MIRISDAVEEEIKNSAYIEVGMMEGLINVSALARKIHPTIEKKCVKKVTISAIVMALNRLEPKFKENWSYSSLLLKKLGKLTVRLKLSEFTYPNTVDLVRNQNEMIERLQHVKDNFFTISTGISETTIITDMANNEMIEDVFKKHKPIAVIHNLSSISIELHPDNIGVHGVYYQVLKAIAWSGINIYQTISTVNEYTLVFANDDLGSALSVLNGLNK